MAKSAKGKWEKLRNEVIELDDCRCVRCGKSRDEGAVLQVHHKYYEPGRDYWDYPLSACETLCSGCHAKEHGIIPPDTGWVSLSDHDLGSCCGICDYCGSALRYSFAIQHPNWGSMDVGEDCCNLLTGTDQASRKMDEHRKRAGRRLRFVQSPHWSLLDDGAYKHELHSYRIVIRREQEGYRIWIDEVRGKKLCPTLDDAMGAAFDALESGKAQQYLLERLASRAAQRT